MRERPRGKEKGAGVEARDKQDRRTAPEAAAVDGAGRAHLRADRRRRDRRRHPARARNSLHWHKASGDIVLVKIDDQSLRDVGRWPWPRRYMAQLIDQPQRRGRETHLLRHQFLRRDRPCGRPRARRRARSARGRVILRDTHRSGPASAGPRAGFRSRPVHRHAGLGTISWRYNFQNASGMPYSATINGKPIPSFAAMLAGARGRRGMQFQLDYSLDPEVDPERLGCDVLKAGSIRELIRGKEIVVGIDERRNRRPVISCLALASIPGAYVHIIGAETLKAGRRSTSAGFPLFLAALAVGATPWPAAAGVGKGLTLVRGASPLLLAPVVAGSQSHLRRCHPRPVRPHGCRLRPRGGAIRGARAGQSNFRSAEPQRTARRTGTDEAGADRRARAQLRRDRRRRCRRTASGSSSSRSCRGLTSARPTVPVPGRQRHLRLVRAAARSPFGNHLDALYSLFRNPARVGGTPIDLAIAFGVEVGSGRSLANRLASALVAADEAAHQGLKWKYHDPEIARRMRRGSCRC